MLPFSLVCCIYNAQIDHFTVVCSVTWPLNGSEDGGDLALIQTSLVLIHTVPNTNIKSLLTHQIFLKNKGGKSLKKLWCCVGGSIAR